MLMCSQIHEVSQNPGHASHIVQIKHIILFMLIILILTYVAWRVGQNMVDLQTATLRDAKLMLFQQISIVHVLHGAEGSPRSDELAHCSTPLLAQNRLCCGLTFIHGIYFFLTLGTCTNFFFQRGFHNFLFFNFAYTNPVLLFSDEALFIPSSRSACQAAENSSE